MQRCTMPSPPQTRISSAPCFRAWRACFGAFLLFGTSNQAGSVIPAAPRARRSSGRPPPSDFRRWAMTATLAVVTSSAAAAVAAELVRSTVSHRKRLRPRRAPRPDGQDGHHEDGAPEDVAEDHVGRVVEAPVDPGEAHRQPGSSAAASQASARHTKARPVALTKRAIAP